MKSALHQSYISLPRLLNFTCGFHSATIFPLLTERFFGNEVFPVAAPKTHTQMYQWNSSLSPLACEWERLLCCCAAERATIDWFSFVWCDQLIKKVAARGQRHALQSSNLNFEIQNTLCYISARERCFCMTPLDLTAALIATCDCFNRVQRR